MVVSAVEPLAAEKRLAFKAEVAADLPVGRVDGRRLSQILLNLLAMPLKGKGSKFYFMLPVRVEPQTGQS